MKYTIKHHTEETACEYCGCPLYVGDTVYLSETDEPFCSKHCEAEFDKMVGGEL